MVDVGLTWDFEAGFLVYISVGLEALFHLELLIYKSSSLATWYWKVEE